MATAIECKQTRSRPADRTTHLFIILIAISALVLCALLGARREARQEALDRAQRAAVPLAYGAHLPGLIVRTTSGRRLETQQLRGEWTLLVFSDTWCEPCAMELRALAHGYQRLEAHVRILPIIEGHPLLGSPGAVAVGFAHRNRLPFEMGLDPSGKAAALCGIVTGALPYAVLVDPTGVVRMTDTGHQPGSNGSSRLTDGLLSYFTGSTPESMPLLRWKRFTRAPDLSVTLLGGQHTSLARLSGSGTLVVTFLTGGDPLEVVRIRAIRRYAKATGVRFLFVVPEPGAKPTNLGSGDGMLVAETDTKPIFTAYNVDRGPVSMILRQGRVVLREEVAQPLGDPFETELAYAILLSSSRQTSRAARGNSWPDRRMATAG